MAIFDKLHHICIVVHDIDKTQAYYQSIGIGPWTLNPPLVQYEELEVPSRDGFMAMQYRICNLPSVQLQLCQPSKDPSPQRIHLDTKGEGVSNIGFEVPDADVAEAEARRTGPSVLMPAPATAPASPTTTPPTRQASSYSTRATNLSGK